MESASGKVSHSDHERHPPYAVCPYCDQAIPNERAQEIRARIESREMELGAVLELRLRKDLEKEKANLTAKAAADVAAAGKRAEASIAEANKNMAARIEVARQEEAKKVKAAAAAEGKKAEVALKATQKAELQRQREILAKDKDAAVNAERSKHFKEKLKIEDQVRQLERKVRRQPADELGEGAELDLFEALKQAYPEDLITRVQKGVAGADITQEIREDGEKCGCILYDSKNRNAWQNAYVTKLRQDQLAIEADHAVLVSDVFPSGARQLHIQDGVVIAAMLRQQTIQTHVLRLSTEARAEKMAALYDYITSERCTQQLDQIAVVTEDLLELEVKEKADHDRRWNKRGALLKSVQRAHGNVTSDISRIIAKADGSIRVAQ